MRPKFSSAPKPANSLAAKTRQWHKWGGVLAGMFLLLAATSGIVLNYKQPLFSALGLEMNPRKPAKTDDQPAKAEKLAFTTRSGFAGLPVSFERALELARAEWGGVPLERIELKDERGEMIYKLKRKGGDELWVNATTGAHFVKGEYEKITRAGGDFSARQTDWGKILLDLHTGKIGGAVGKAIMSLAAVVLLLLTFSGIYLWAKPLLKRRTPAKAQVNAAKPEVRDAMPVEV